MSNILYVTKTDGDWGTSLGNMGLSNSNFHHKVEKYCNENEILKTGIEFRMINGYWKLEIHFIDEVSMNMFKLLFSHEATFEQDYVS